VTAQPVSTTHSPAAHPIVLFDGVCNFCNSAVAWIIRRDRRGVFRFASLQSSAGRAAVMAAHGPAELPDSVVLITGGVVLVRSDAAIAIVRGLGFPWSLACVALILPRPLRDGLYSWIARNRYRWFGKREACMVPEPHLRERFLD